MKVKQAKNGDTIIRVSADEAHVLIWGGPEDLFYGMQGTMRTLMVGIEDKMPAKEYVKRFGILSDLYARLRAA